MSTETTTEQSASNAAARLTFRLDSAEGDLAEVKRLQRRLRTLTNRLLTAQAAGKKTEALVQDIRMEHRALQRASKYYQDHVESMARSVGDLDGR